MVRRPGLQSTFIEPLFPPAFNRPRPGAPPPSRQWPEKACIGQGSKYLAGLHQGSAWRRLAGIVLRLTLLLVPLLLHAQAAPDTVAELVETMRRLAFAGDQRAVGRIVPALVQALAKPHPQSALAWNQIGAYHAMEGDFSEAENAYRRGIQFAERTGAGRDTMALLLLNLGQLRLETADDTVQTERILGRALKLAEQSYAPDSEELSNFIYVLAVAQNRSGNRREARQQFARALAIAEQSRGRELRRGAILANLAVLRAEDKQWREADSLIRNAIALLEQNLGPTHPQLVPVYLNFARIQTRLKHWDVALSALERARVNTETRLGPAHGYMVAVLEASAFILRKTGRHAEAREQARRAKWIADSLPSARVGETWIHLSDLRK